MHVRNTEDRLLEMAETKKKNELLTSNLISKQCHKTVLSRDNIKKSL